MGSNASDVQAMTVDGVQLGMLQGSHFVTSYSCWFVMTRGYFIPRAYRSCRRWKASMLSFMAVLFHGTYGDHFSPLYVFFGVEQASK